MNLRIKNTSITLKALGWLQIIGGLLGFWVMARIMLYTDVLSGGALLVILIGLGLFSLSIYAGRYLLSKKDIGYGIIFSIVNQALQILHFSMFGNGFGYSSGMMGLIGIESGFKFNISAFASTFHMSYLLEEYTFMFKINLIPVFLIIVLVDIWRERQQPVESEELNQAVVS